MSTPFIPTGYSQIKDQLQSEKSGGYWGGYYKPGVYGMTPTQKKSFSGRILPAFDYTLSPADQDFDKSWSAYRNVDRIDPTTGQPELSSFFAVVSAYSWFGNKQVSFLSPTTLRYTHGITKGPELIDPVQDLRNYAKKHSDPAIRALTERAEQKKEAKIIIPYAQKRYVFNTYGAAGTTDRTMRNYLVDVAQKAFEDLAGKLAEWRPAHESIIDPNWPTYLFGDITDPSTGLMVDTVQLPSNPQPFNGFIFTQGSHKSLNGTRQIPVPPNALTGRYHLYGDKSVIKILSAQEIVDFLVEDGAIPYHLIQEVCSHYCNIPPQPKHASVFPGSQHEEEEESVYVPQVPTYTPARVAPTSVAPPPPVVVSAPPPLPPPAAEKLYWVSVNEAPPVKMNPAGITDLANSVPWNQKIMVCPEGDTSWSTAEAMGFAVPHFSAPPVPSAPPPFNPPSVAPSSPPAVAAATSKEAPGLTPEEKAEMEALHADFLSGKLNGGDPESIQRLARFAALSVKTDKAAK